jgi:GDSL-like Lipase/Acylhydrolase family
MIQQPTCAVAARFALLQPLLLVVAGLIAWPSDWEGVRAVIDCARSPEPGPARREAGVIPYYEGLINGSSGAGSRGPNRPAGWINFKEADVIRYLDDDFLLFELKPEVRRTLNGQPFETNAHGMHGAAVTAEKPEGTFRIALLGASMDMGWGVRYQDIYVNQLQQWLAAGAGATGRYEVLNFAVAAYSPLQRLEALRRKVLAFHPDLVIYSATTLDVRLTEIHLCELLRQRIDLKYDFVREAVARAGVGRDDLWDDRDSPRLRKQRLKRLKGKLEPWYWGIYDRTLGAIAAECRSAGVPLAMVIIPRVDPEDAPQLRAEPVARLKALAAHNAITTFDLSDAFDHDDPAALEVASWDEHPNATGHARLFEALSRALAADSTLAPLLFPGDPPTPGQAARLPRVGQAFQPDRY